MQWHYFIVLLESGLVSKYSQHFGLGEEVLKCVSVKCPGGKFEVL